jgi:hypothetical protein
MCQNCEYDYHARCTSPVRLDETLSYTCCCESAIPETSSPVPEEVIEANSDDDEVFLRRLKNLNELKDPDSTGRKRAVLIKPIEKGVTVCEWAGLANAGGGVISITGCMGNKAVNVHHGPDKNRTNNAEDNLHRICSPCHNLWHAKNDPHYNPDTLLPKDSAPVPHDPITRAKSVDLITLAATRKEF